MDILLVEPFFTGSHRQWAEGYRRYSRHRVDLLTLPGRHWKWRMHGAAVTLARRFAERRLRPDLLLAGDMLDLPTFLALLPRRARTLPAALYFHENQLTYPWSPEDPDRLNQRDQHYAFTNYRSALSADAVFFNSHFHRQSFLEALPGFLRQFPDHRETASVTAIAAKSRVLPLGLDLRALQTQQPVDKPPEAVILWNHRWEYDKNPDAFFHILFQLAEEGLPFAVVVLGEAYRQAPPIFEEARRRLAGRLLHFGFVSDRRQYQRWLWTADILPVTSRQDFFGAGVVEAIYCNCHPLLPNRLAFPEHVPAGHLYADERELHEQLKSAILSIETIRREGRYQHFAARYDWSTLAEQYDTAFDELSEHLKTADKI